MRCQEGVGKGKPQTGTPQKMGVSRCLGGDLDITLRNKTDVLVPLKARSGGNFQACPR